MLIKHNYRETGTTIGFRSIRWICFLVAILPCVPEARGATVTLAEGQTLDWATQGLAANDVLEAFGGSIVNFSGASKVRFDLSGVVSVTLADGSSPTLTSCKMLKSAPAGKLVFAGSVTVKGAEGSYSVIDDDAIAFADGASGATLTLTSYVGCLTLPETWAIADRVRYSSGAILVLYGTDMKTSVSGIYTVPANGYTRITRPDNFDKDVTINVPDGAALTVRYMTYNANTGSGSAQSADTILHLTNDVTLAGGRLAVNTDTPFRYYGAVSGTGTIDSQFSSTVAKTDTSKKRYRYFYGSLEGLDSASVIKCNCETPSVSGREYDTRVASSFPGTIEMYGTCPTNTVSFGTLSNGGTYSFGAIRSYGKVTPSKTATFYGPCLQYWANQYWTVGTLSGDIAVRPSQTANSCDLEIANVEANSEIWIRYGIRLKIGTLGTGVKLHYMSNQNYSSNVVEVATGNPAFAEIELMGEGNTVNLKGASVDSVIGNGTIKVLDGNVRIGAVPDTVNVQVQGGTVTFGNDVDVSAVLAKSALWLDASDTAKMVGAYNTGWAKSTSGKAVLAAHPAVTFNGSLTATWTNAFPLIEKWFDKRPEQTENYGWQDRCVDYGSTLYTLVYPYLVPNGLNGRAYMSFGVHGETDLPDSDGTSRTSGKTNLHRERRRMPIMHDMNGKEYPTGNAIYACATILVFGSQQGGGRAVLGGYNGNDRWTTSPATNNASCSAWYLRGGSDYGAANPLLESDTKKAAWIDGESVDPATTGLSGGWQVISITNTAAYWRSLGEGEFSSSAANSGGQNYAEVISFTNAITSAEREAVERYLALKWGLTNALPVKGPVSVAAGATVKGAVAGVTGDGTWELNLPETTLSMDGSFTGALAGGGVITVADVADMPSLDAAFDGSVNVTGGNLTFTYANGAFTPAIVAPEADLTFPSAPTIEIAAPDGIEPGDYTLVSGKTLAGLDNCVLESSKIDRRCLSLKRESSSLVLRVTNLGLMIFVQ